MPDNTNFLGGVFGPPAYWNGNIYTAAINDTLKQFTIASGTISATPHSHSAGIYGKRGSVPAVSATGTTSGIVWAVDIAGYPTGCRDPERLRRHQPRHPALQQPGQRNGRCRPRLKVHGAHRGQWKGLPGYAGPVRCVRIASLKSIAKNTRVPHFSRFSREVGLYLAARIYITFLRPGFSDDCPLASAELSTQKNPTSRKKREMGHPQSELSSNFS